MRILNVVAGQKWTGIAAVVFDQTEALVRAGVEAQYAYVGDGPLARRLHPLGWARPLLVPLDGPLAYLREARRLSGTFRRERFDVVHAHATHDHWASARALAGTGIPLVRTIHNVRHARRGGLSRLLDRRTAAWAFANREIGRAFGRPGPIQSPVIDVERFRPPASKAAARREAGLPAEGFLAGTVGKIAEGRGHRETVAAAAPLPGVTLAHVGYGDRLPALQELARTLGSSARNLFLGYQEETLPSLVRAWDAFVFPASGSEQGQRAILEAMASGVPVVAVAVPGVADLMTDGVEGIVVPETGGIGPALARLAADPALRSAMGARGRERSLAFTAEKFAAQAVSFYESVLRGEKRS